MSEIQKILDVSNLGLSFKDILQNPLFLVDFIIVLVIFFWFYQLLKNTRAVRILYGVLILGILMYLSSFLHLVLLSWVLGGFLTIVLVAIPVVFQPELRNTLEKIGRTGISAANFKTLAVSEHLETILDAVKIMSHNKIGGIIAIKRNSGLNDYLKSGVELNAKLSKELIISTFIYESPLHDGGMIISNDKILGASCIFPLTENQDTITLGTRHKAAIGLSEQTDAICIVVSERDGGISLAIDGSLEKNISYEELAKKVKSLFGKNSGGKLFSIKKKY